MHSLKATEAPQNTHARYGNSSISLCDSSCRPAIDAAQHCMLSMCFNGQTNNGKIMSFKYDYRDWP